MDQIYTPILLVGFNRPHCIRKVMQQLEMVKPEKVYFSIDAAREGRDGEAELVEQVKAIVKDVKWECDCHYRFFDKNVGAEVNVSSGVSWVLEENDCVIVNEDDIYAGYAFYRFEQDMLNHYKDDERIGLVSGLNLSPVDDSKLHDYFISRSGHIWGWGTWKRVWDKYSLYEEIKDDVISLPRLTEYYGNKNMAVNVRNIFLKQKGKGIGNVTWDHMFWYNRIKMNYFAIVPNKSLVTNIGVNGLHASGFSLTHFTPMVNEFAINSYHDFLWDKDYDIKNSKNSFKRSKAAKAIKLIIDKVIIGYLRRTKFTDEFFASFFNS